MNLTEEQIKKINSKSDYNQGIFIEPFGCDGIKELVIYMRWCIGGITGRSCWGTEERYRDADPKPKFKVLDLILKELKPNITFLQFREIEDLIVSVNKDGCGDYYGNHSEYGIEYIKLSDLQLKLADFDCESTSEEDND